MDADYWAVSEHAGRLLLFSIAEAAFHDRLSAMGLELPPSALELLQRCAHDGARPPKAFVGERLGVVVIGGGEDAADPVVCGREPCLRDLMRRPSGGAALPL